MSLALHLAADATADLRRLEPWLQEEVLDELDRFTANPASIPPPVADWGSVDVVFRAHQGEPHFVTLTMDYNQTRRTLVVLGIESLF